MKTGADLQRANRRLLLAMIVFALALCALCLVWMYSRMRRAENGVLSGDNRPANVLSINAVASLPPTHFHLTSP